MKKISLEIYALTVCFVAVICFVVSLGLAAYSTIGMINPEFTMASWAYTQHQTNALFWNGVTGPRFPGSDEKTKDRPSEPELTKQREESYTRALESERRDSVQMIVKSSIVIVIDLVVFLFHWRSVRRIRVNEA